MRNSMKTLILWVVLMVAFVAIYRFFQTSSTPPAQLTWERLEAAIELDEVEHLEVEVDDGLGLARVRLRGGERLHTERRPIADFTALEARGVAVTFKNADTNENGLLAQSLPIVLLFIFFLFFMRRFTNKNASDLLKYEPTPAAISQAPSLRGLDVARAALKDAVDAAKSGQPGTRRFLLVGPPGTGKTTLLRCAAFDAKVPLLGCAGSEFVEIFVGVGASRIRKVFEVATSSQPCLLAIDDLDAFASVRVRPDEAGKVDERATTLLELNNRLDGLVPFPPKVVFVATTSRPELLDPAVVRRFQVTISLRADGTCTVDPTTPGPV